MSFASTWISRVKAIEKGSGQSLNIIIPAESAGAVLPPLKMRNASLQEFFAALSESSLKIVRLPNGVGSSTRYRFQNMGNGKNAVWFFRQDQSPEPPQICRYYQLADLLNEHSIEDITTAIQTGWKLLKVDPAPQLKFHRETQLLIAVGTEGELQTIDSVLSELRRGRGIKPGKSAPKADETPEKK
jgi:hypothetical protein